MDQKVKAEPAAAAAADLWQDFHQISRVLEYTHVKAAAAADLWQDFHQIFRVLEYTCLGSNSSS